MRPEFIESTLFLYQATKDPMYLQIGKEILRNLQQFTRTPCGFASITDIKTKKLEDRLDSYFFSETLKYLYLLFDPQNIYNSEDFVFTTEGHPIPISIQNLRTYPSFPISKPTCSPFEISFESQLENKDTAFEVTPVSPKSSMISDRELQHILGKVISGIYTLVFSKSFFFF